MLKAFEHDEEIRMKTNYYRVEFDNDREGFGKNSLQTISRGT